MYSLRTFGSLALTRDGLAVEPFGASRKSLAILTVLATDGTVTRDRLMALLWPESDTERARGSLKQAVHALRQQLQAPDLVIGRADLSLNPDLIESDVARFRTALGVSNFIEAVDLYRGPFLDGVHLNGSGELEEWEDARRTMLAQQYRGALDRLAREAESRGDTAEAVRWRTQRAMEDPLDGKAALRLMLALEAVGEPTAALQHFRAHESALSRELGLAPDPPLIALAERLLSKPHPLNTFKTVGPAASATEDSLPLPDMPGAGASPARANRTSRSRWGWAAGIVLAVGGMLGWGVLSGGRQPMTEPSSADPAVAVLPYRVVGPGAEYLSEGMVDLLSFNIEGIKGLRKIDPTTLITAWKALGGTDSAAMDEPGAIAVARRVQARYLLTGSAVRLGDQIRLVAEVRDVERGEFRGLAQVSGPVDSVPRLIDQLTLELLRLDLLPSDGEHQPVSLSQVTTASLPALKAYLAGEREYRVAHWQDAAQHYLRAIDLDSTFARAWYRLIKASDWGGGVAGNPDYIRRLAPLVQRLPERDRMLIAGDLGIKVNGLDPDSVPGFILLEKLTQRYPDDVEGWVALGERYFHDHGSALLPTSTYRHAFARAIQLNPYYREPYVHLIEDAFLQLDSAGARQLIGEYAAIGGSHEGCSFQLAYNLVWGPPAAGERALAALDTIVPHAAWNGCLPIGPMAASPRVMDRIGAMYRVVADTSSDSWATAVALYQLRLKLLAPRGRVADLRKAFTSTESDTWAPGWQIMLHLSEFPDSLAAHDAAEAMEDKPHPVAGVWIGMLAVAERRWTDAEQAGRALDLRSQELRAAGDSTLAEAAEAYAAALRAYMRFVRVERAPLREVELAIGRLPNPRIYAPPSSYLRYQLGKHLFEQGRVRDAERYFLSFGPLDFYTSQAELYLGRITEAQGRRAEAIEHYRRFITWWQYADPGLRAPLEEARVAIMRLTQEQRR